VIPTVLLAGLFVGRLWFVPVAAVAWAMLIVGMNDWDAGLFLGAAAFGGANAAVGVAVRYVIERAVDGIEWGWHALRRGH
jgi:hypothetical protein